MSIYNISDSKTDIGLELDTPELERLGPWDKHDAFPPKPVSSHYGYLRFFKLQPCTIQNLGGKVLKGAHLVWTPETDRLVPPEELPLLFLYLKQKYTNILHFRIVQGVLATIISAFYGTIFWSSTNVFPSFFLVMFLFLGLFPVLYSVKKLEALKGLSSGFPREEIRMYRYLSWIRTRKSFYTWWVLILLFFVGLSQYVMGLSSSNSAVGLVKSAVFDGEYWRLLSGVFVHGNTYHFMSNCFALFCLGHIIEAISSRTTMPLVFLCSSIIGSLFSQFLIPEGTTVGASGGIIGLVGFLSFIAIKNSKVFPRQFLNSIMFGVGIISISGIVSYMHIDNAAHLGGFLCGFSMGGLLSIGKAQIPLVSNRFVISAGFLSMAILSFFAALTVILIIY